MIALPERDNAGLQPGEVGTTKQTSDNSTPSISARERRLLLVLKAQGKTSRHDLDRLAGYENTPDGVLRLRRRFGFEIPMVKEPFIDRDGRKVRVGFYDLSQSDCAKLTALGIA